MRKRAGVNESWERPAARRRHLAIARRGPAVQYVAKQRWPAEVVDRALSCWHLQARFRPANAVSHGGLCDPGQNSPIVRAGPDDDQIQIAGGLRGLVWSCCRGGR